MPRITANQLTKYYVDSKTKVAIAGLFEVELDIPSKTFAVIVGPSGCGKTTLLKTLAGIFTPDEGRILFDDRDVTYIPANKRNVSLVSQEFALYPMLTVFDNIAYPLKILKMMPEAIRQEVKTVAIDLGIDFLLSRKPRHLSIGQQQRVALARAIVKKPDLLLLDEPLANLDEPTRKTMLTLLKDIQFSREINFVYVTHNIQDAIYLADYLVTMENGSIVQQGPSAR